MVQQRRLLLAAVRLIMRQYLLVWDPRVPQAKVFDEL